MPRRDEFKFQDERLQHSHRYWREKGLTGEDRNSMFQYVEAYRGIQWGDTWGGLPREDLITVNVTFSNTNTMISQLSHRDPEAIVTPKRKNSDEIRGARIMQLVLRYFWHELKFKRQVDRVLQDALTWPFGILQHGFTPDAAKTDDSGRLLEVYDQARPDLPWIRRRPPWDVRIDPLAESWHADGDARWCAFRSFRTKREIDQTPGMILRDDMEPIVTEERRRIFERTAGVGRADLGPQFSDLYEIWDIYDKVDRTWMATSPGVDKWIREPREWPINWEGLPLSMLQFNPQMDDNVGIAFPEVYKDQQIELNKVSTLMAELVKRLRRVVFLNENWFGGGKDEAEKAVNDLGLKEILLGNGDPKQAMEEMLLGAFPPELPIYRQLVKEDIRETLGLSNMDRAQRINVETATEAQGVLQGSAIHLGRNQQTFEDFLSDSMRSFAQSVQQTLTDPLSFQITGIAEARGIIGAEEGFVTVDRNDIHGEFNYDIRVGSTLPEDLNQEFVKNLQLFQVFGQDAAVNQMELKRNIFEAAGLDSSRMLVTPEEARATQEALQGQGLGGAEGQGGNGVDANVVRSLNPAGSIGQ